MSTETKKRITKKDVRALAEELGCDFIFARDYREDMIAHGWRMTWADVADMMENGDLG